MTNWRVVFGQGQTLQAVIQKVMESHTKLDVEIIVSEVAKEIGVNLQDFEVQIRNAVWDEILMSGFRKDRSKRLLKNKNN